MTLISIIIAHVFSCDQNTYLNCTRFSTAKNVNGLLSGVLVSLLAPSEEAYSWMGMLRHRPHASNVAVDSLLRNKNGGEDFFSKNAA
jgi:hypothetical protein